MTAAEDQAKRILRDILEMTGEDLAERRIAVLALYLDAFRASQPQPQPTAWQAEVLRRIQVLERKTKNLDEADGYFMPDARR